MQLIVRMITVKGSLESFENIVKQFIESTKVRGNSKILKSGEYHKMPGHQEILFELNGRVDFDATVQLVGKHPVLSSENEVIFDKEQGSKIYTDGLQWIHLEII